MPDKLDLATIRTLTGLTNPQLARELGVSLRTLEAYRDGVRGMPWDLQVKLARLTGRRATCPTCDRPL